MDPERQRLLQAVLGWLEDWERSGVSHVNGIQKRSSPWSTGAGVPAGAASSHREIRDPRPALRAASDRPQLHLQPTEGRPTRGDASNSPDEALDVIRREVADCVACAELAATRTQTVFGVGNPRARLCFLGEAPGADEDRQGEPFVGRAGQLLTKIIEACRLSRGEVYILNTLKCRPPGNRNPLPEELRNCRGFLDRQLEVIRPEFICCLGAVAAQSLLGVTIPISRLRGRFFDYEGIRVMCTYHPAYLLRNPAAKKETWEDMKMLMREMGIVLP